MFEKQSEIDTVIYANTFRKDDLHWRSIIFLPFNIFWRITVALSGVIYFNLVIYQEIFQISQGAAETKILNMITILYVIDTLLSVLHKTWESVQKSMPFAPKSTFVLLMDVFSILPIGTFLTSPLLNKSKHTINWIQIINMNGCLRVYRIFVEFIHLKQRKETNAIVLFVVQHTVLTLSLASVLSSIWFTLGFALTYERFANEDNPRRKSLSWMDEINMATSIDTSRPFNMYLFTITHIYVLLSNETITDLRCVNYFEILFVVLILYFGFILRYGYLFSSAINSFLRSQKHMYRIKSHIKINIKCMRGKKIDEMKRYYNTHWKNWSGLNKCPLLDKFPLCLRKDVLTDVYWNAISHSHILRHFTINIKRQLSLVMDSKFLQPGEYIFRKGEIKNKYYYIASGVIQIMSHYDGVSPVMTISDGSCLGGLALTLCTPSATDVICASVCEVRLLTYKHLYDVIMEYPNGLKILREIERQYIAQAKKTFVLSKSYRNENLIMKLYGVPQEDKLKWIKHRWRTTRDVEEQVFDLSNRLIKKIQEDLLPIDVTHMSKHLDIIVLRSEEKWEADKCCTKSKCPYVLDPDCNFVKIWLTFICGVIAIDSFVVPYRAAFLTRTSDFQVGWDHVVCFAYMFDVYFQAITGVRSAENTIMEPMPLLRHHLKSPLFLIDIIGAIPTQEIARLYYQEYEIKPTMALIRLCKFVRVFSYFRYKYGLIMSNYMSTHIIKYLYLLCFVLFLSTSAAFMNACSYDVYKREVKCLNSSWYLVQTGWEKIEIPDDLQEKEKLAQDVLSKSLLESINFVYRYVLKTGLKEFPPKTMRDITVCGAIVFVANHLFVLIAAELITRRILLNQRKVACEELIKDLKCVLSQKSVHKGLLHILDLSLSLQWKVSAAVEQDLHETPCSEIISPILESERQKIIMHCLKKIEFFQLLSKDSYTKICNAVRLFTVPEEFIFCRAGDQPSSFNIIINGYCNLTSMLKEDVYAHPNGKLIGPGQSFPLMEVAQNIPCFQTTVSVTVCEVAAIDVIVLRGILYRDEIIALNIQSAIDFSVSDVDVVISKKKYFKVAYEIPSFVRCKRKRQSAGEIIPFWKIILRYVSYFWKPPYMIHPSGRFLFVWETIKVIQVILTLFFLPLFHMIICRNVVTVLSITLILDGISMIDVVIRFYIGHYNEIGILIYNSHYLYNSFCIDLISSFPVHFLITNYNFQIQFFLNALLKSLQVYRINGYMKAFQKRFHLGRFKYLFINFFIHWMLISSIFASCLYVNDCEVKCQNGTQVLTCKEYTCLLSSNLFQEKWTPYNLLPVSFNIILTVFLSNDQFGFNIPIHAKKHEVLLIIIFGAIALAAKYYYISQGASSLIGGYVNFTKHRENMALYWFFIENEGGSKELAQTIAKHFSFQYTKLRGIKMQEFIYTLHPSLQSDLTYAIYYKSMLCLHRFVGESTSLMKRLTKKVDEIYFQKNNVVIDINEVSNRIYFIREGNIRVYNKEKEYMKELGPGSMFGSFKVLGKKRHQKEFISHDQTNLLVIDSREFFVILRDCGRHLEKRFVKDNEEREYLSYQTKSGERKKSTASLGSGHVESESNFPEEAEKYSLLHRNRPCYKWAMFFLSMLVPYFTTFPLLLSIICVSDHETLEVSIIYVMDVFSYLKICLALFSTYTDEITGVHMNNMYQIRKKYLLTPSQFLLDFSSCFPVELFGYIFNHKLYNFLRFNRILKLVIMLKFIKYHSNKIYIRPWFRWFEFIAFITLVPFIFVCTWQFLTCRDGCSVVYHSEVTKVHDPDEMFLQSLRHIISLYTFSPAYDLQKPWNTRECLIMIFISVISFMLLPAVIGSFTQVSQMSNFSQKLFDYNVQCMKIYLQLRDLSESLLETLWNYSFSIWKSDRGEILPAYVDNAPSNLKCELVFDLYGAHIKFNILFDECHDDFIVQLSGRLKRSIYFPGDFIIRKLDIDGRMYFINSGEVEAVESDELFNEIVKDVFITGQCFGLCQGLYDRVAHMITYKARSMVEMLTLAKNDWDDLVTAFPEERKKIYSVATRLSLYDLPFRKL